MQNLVHDLLAVRKISSSEAVHIGITDFELPGQDLLLHTGHHLFHNLYAAHELLRSDNVRFTDVVPLRNLLADARFRRGGRNCVNLTQFLRGGFLGSSCVLVVAVSTGLSMLHTVLLSNEELLLLRREVAPPQLVLTNPSENFFSAFKRERYGGEINLRVFLEDGITAVTINKGIAQILIEDYTYLLLSAFATLWTSMSVYTTSNLRFPMISAYRANPPSVFSAFG